MWTAFPPADYYEDSVPRWSPMQTMRTPFATWREGETIAVPTFTDHRMMGAASSFTPATLRRVHHSLPRNRPTPIG
jgi:hypothetical protein